MKTKRALTAMMLLSALAVTPAAANYFHNPYTNISLNVGSAPNPTPADLRYMAGRYVYVSTDVADLDGKDVYGEHGEYLGHILAVDETARLAELQLPDGPAVTLPTTSLVDKGSHVVAPRLSQGDVLAMLDRPITTIALNDEGAVIIED